MREKCCDKYSGVALTKPSTIDKQFPPNRTQTTVNINSTKKYTHILHAIYYLIILFHFPISCQGFCPSKCICDDESLKVECTNASLDLIPFLLNPMMQVLSLPCNKIETVSQSLTFYPDLKEIDLSYNHIKSIEAQDFEMQKNLQVLNLNKNRLRLIQNKSLVPLTELKELYLSHNILTSIEPNSFYGSNELKVLDLSNNKFKSLSDSTFNSANMVEVIKLSYNYFPQVPSNAISKVQSLKELDLTGNLISEIPKNAFYSLINLAAITLDKNNISSVSSGTFAGLSRLKSLSIKDNRLEYLSADLFGPLVRLESLDLSGNLFQEIDKTAFPVLSSLVRLRLTRCPRLYRIHSEAFVNLKALETLQLSHNARLVYLGEATFSALDRLTDLDLTACGLTFVHPNQMPRRNRETKLHLAGNPLHCNCSLLWLASLPFNNSFYFDAPTCATPPTLYGVPVNHVDLQEAGCEHHLGLAAIGTCVGVVLLGLLVIAVFLAWRWRKRTLSTTKALAGNPERDLRESWGGPSVPPSNIAYQGGPICVSKYCLPTQISMPSCGHTQCQGGCTTLPHPPYSLHPVTRPLLTPPSPALNNHPQLPVDLLFPSPYEEETHWYTTIGRDGREYLTGELKRDQHPTPPPLPQDSPPPHLPPSSPALAHLKRKDSCQGKRSNRPPVPPIVRQIGTPPLPGERIPITYI